MSESDELLQLVISIGDAINVMGYTRSNEGRGFFLHGKRYAPDTYLTLVADVYENVKVDDPEIIKTGINLVLLFQIFVKEDLKHIWFPEGTDGKFTWHDLKKLGRDWFKNGAEKMFPGVYDFSGISQSVTPVSTQSSPYSPSPKAIPSPRSAIRLTSPRSAIRLTSPRSVATPKSLARSVATPKSVPRSLAFPKSVPRSVAVPKSVPRRTSPVRSPGSRGTSPVRSPGSRGTSPVRSPGSRGTSPVRSPGSPRRLGSVRPTKSPKLPMYGETIRVYPVPPELEGEAREAIRLSKMDKSPSPRKQSPTSAQGSKSPSSPRSRGVR